MLFTLELRHVLKIISLALRSTFLSTFRYRHNPGFSEDSTWLNIFSLPFFGTLCNDNRCNSIRLPLDRTLLMDGASWVICLEPSLKPHRRLSFLLAERTRHDSATVLLCIWMASQIVFNCRFNPILQSQCAKCLRKFFVPNCKLCF